jgi:thymidylate synthase
MNNLDKTYTALLQDILDNGVEKKDRTGTGTLSVFGRQIRHNMSEGFPLLTTKKMAWKTIVVELMWFLRGDTNIKYLVDNDCHIWDGDAYKNYEKWWKSYSPGGAPIPLSKEKFINKIKTDNEFAEKYGELGKIYGKQWRSWEGYPEKWRTQDRYGNWMWQTTESGNTRHVDQIANLINDLKTNPDSRRLMVNAWNVGELDQMVLPPCHYGFQVYTRELTFGEKFDLAVGKKGEWEQNMKNMEEGREFYLSPAGIESRFDDPNFPKRAISLMWNQRSVDTFLGLPFNIASYGLLLMMIADEVNMVPDELIGNLGDVHLYLNHIEQAREQIGREMSLEERAKWLQDNKGYDLLVGNLEHDHIREVVETESPTRTREPYPLPTVHVRDGIFCSSVNDVILENYQSHLTIKAPLSN